MSKTYEIVKQPTGKYNVIYYIDGEQENIEFHSTDGINGTVREGYTKIIDLGTINEFKTFLIEAIDNQTSDLISQGFTFDGCLFSMSVNAQTNWSNIPNIPDAFFPLTLSTKDDGVYSLSLANKQNFYLTALGFKYTHLQNGTALKQQVKSCATIEELQFIQNNL